MLLFCFVPGNPDQMNRVDRLFGILMMLQSKKYVPAEQIAAKFDISIRTVYRDIRALGELGIPLSFEPSKGYFVVQGYFLQPVAFTTEEANALLLVETLARGFADRSIHAHYASALQKIRAVLKSPQRESLEALGTQIKGQIPPEYQPNYGYLSLIQEAIASKSVLELEYRNSSDELTRRCIEPVGLIFYAFHWHLIAWCRLRGSYRDFRVSRIVSMSRTRLPFSKTDHLSLDDYMQHLPVDY